MAIRPAMSPEIIEWCTAFFKGKQLRVLEWGAGHSTIVYPTLLAAGSQWIAIETDQQWSEFVRHYAPPAVHLIQVDYGSCCFFGKPSRLAPYDVVIVDGPDATRPKCLELARTAGMLLPGGVILLHDAQRPHYHAACEGLKIEKVLGSEGDDLWVMRP